MTLHRLEKATMADFGIPDTVRERVFEPTHRWEVRFVYDSNWGKAVPAVVRPDGVLDHVYGGFPEGVSAAETYVDDKNYEPPMDDPVTL